MGTPGRREEVIVPVARGGGGGGGGDGLGEAGRHLIPRCGVRQLPSCLSLGGDGRRGR